MREIRSVPHAARTGNFSFLAGQERNHSTDPLAMYRDALMELPVRQESAE